MTSDNVRIGRSLRAAIVTALLLPYLVLQSITFGVMPVLGQDGLTFVICTGDDVVKAVLNPDGNFGSDPEDPSASHGAEAECPWAVADGPQSLALEQALPSADISKRPIALSQSAPWVLTGEHRLAALARGPPLAA